METIIVKGVITDDGQLKVEIPDDLPPGPVEVEIRRPETQGITLGEILKSDLIGMWADREDITDSVEFARELRRRASRRRSK